MEQFGMVESDSRRQRGFIPEAAFLASTAFAAMLLLAVPANAACTPPAGNNVTATCTGVTVNQNGTSGYGTGGETNLNTTVAPGATVTGTNFGIAFSTGSVTNFGAVSVISAPNSTIVGFNSLTVVNSGTITGGSAGYGVATLGSGTLTNSGTITGGLAGFGVAGAG